MKKQLRTFQESTIEHLKKDKEAAQAYLEVAMEEFDNDGDIGALLRSLRNFAEAQGGMTWLSRKTNVNRQHLYDALSGDSNPRIDTLLKILTPLGYKVSFRRTNA